MERFWKWSQLTFRLNKPCLCSLWCIYRQYQQSYFLLRTIFTLCSKTHLVTSNYVFDDSSKTTITQSSLRNELKLNLPEVTPGGGKVSRASCCRCCCCCCDLARAACPSRDSAPTETFFSPEMSDTHTHKIAIHRVQKKRCHWFFCCSFYKYWHIFYNFSCTTSQENAKVTGVKISCHTLVMLLPYRVKFSNTKVTHFTPILALCTRLHRSHLQKPVSMKQTKHSRSQRLKIYVQNVHHSREHMHSNHTTPPSTPKCLDPFLLKPNTPLSRYDCHGIKFNTLCVVDIKMRT